MATTLNAATFMGKNFSTMQSVVKNHESLTLKQMFDVTAQLVNNQEEINCLDKILYGKNSWTHLSLIHDEVVINLQSTKVCVFSDSVLCLGKVLQHPECNEAWKNRVVGVRAERSYRDYDAINGESTEFEWKIFTGFTTLMKDIDSVPSNVQSARQEASLYVFEDNEAVIKMIIKGRSPTMRHVSRTHRVALDWLFDRINLEPKIQIKYIDTKNQLADILTKGNFTCDEWNHLLNLFEISHFSSTACTAAMAKRAQQESGEERVTAKSRPMMNLTARMLSVVSSSTSSNPGRTWHGYQDLGKSVVDDRSGKPERPSPAGYSEEDYGRSWSSQEWKSGAAAHDRSGKPEKISWDAMQQVVPHHEEPLLDGNVHSVRYGEMVHDGSGKPEKVNSQEGTDSETFVTGSDAAEFVNKVKDQVRNRQKKCRTLQNQKSIQ